MIHNYYKNINYTVSEQFFVEKGFELVFLKTIDTHRVRLNNPYTILRELVQVLTDWHEGKINIFDTVSFVIRETEALIKDCSVLQFQKIGKNYYHELLKDATGKKYLDLYYSTKILVEENKGYLKRLFDTVHRELKRLNSIKIKLEMHELEQLNKLTGYLITDLLNFGYSKNYVNHILYTLFTNKSEITFDESFKICSDLFERHSEKFSVVFKIKVPEDLKEKINLEKLLIPDDHIEQIKTLNSETKLFVETKSHNFDKLIKIDVHAKDYYVAIKKAKTAISEELDFVFLGFNHPGLKIYNQSLVIGERNPKKARPNPIFYQIDGAYKVGQDLYESFLSKLSKVSSNPKVSKDSNEKIKSAIRYLRLGSEAIEIEQKFINFWIGLEYIFSSYSSDISTFSRLKQNLVTIHSLVYVKRNLKEFHEDLRRQKRLKLVPGHSDTLEYLKEAKSFDFIKDHFSDSFPLLSYRAYELKKSLFHNDRLTKSIKKHQANLEAHLSRAYRIRNEIIHDAAIRPNIESITSNLKYYLTFIVNEILEFFLNNPIDANLDKQLSIDDFFIVRQLEFNSIQSTGFTLERMFEIKNTVQEFS